MNTTIKQINEWLNDTKETGAYSKGYRKALKDVKSLMGKQVGAWISVTERLPEERNYPPVVCCNVEDKWTDAAFVSDNGYFINCEGIIIRPTHWKPLPTPWEEEQPC